MNLGFFECSFCNKRWVKSKEAGFKKHKCDLMERDEFVRTTRRGRFAFEVYKTWIRLRGYQPQDRGTFIESRYYNTILKFAEFYYATMLPDMEDYIRFMVREDMLPNMWTHTTLYEQYILEFDERVKPVQQAEISFKHLNTLAKSLDCEPAEVFDYLYVNDIVKLIQCRRLSPWVLLASRRFNRYMAEVSDDERPVLETMVNLDVWLPRFREKPEDSAIITNLTKALGI